MGEIGDVPANRGRGIEGFRENRRRCDQKRKVELRKHEAVKCKFTEVSLGKDGI
jgi:hypothetical protein